MPRALPELVIVEGSGTPLLLIHGTAADADAWTIQRAMLADRFRLVIYDRRGTPRSPVPEPAGAGPDDCSAPSYSVDQHALDAAELVEACCGGPAILCGSSFGGIVALELCRQRPELVLGAVLCEPPLPPSDDGPALPPGFADQLAQTATTEGEQAGADLFLRMVLGDASFARLANVWRERAGRLYRQIELDTKALADYRVDYASLASVHVPVLLCGGDRSTDYFPPTLAALAEALPLARRVTLRGAGHMMHAEAFRQFHTELSDFAAALARSQ